MTMAIARYGLIIAATLALSACQLPGQQKPPSLPVAETAPPTKSDRWLSVASAEDADRLRRLPMAWSEALAEARTAANAGGFRAEGDLLRRDAGLARPAPTPGSYNCRVVRLGRTDRRSPTFVRFKPFFCYVEVEDDLLTIVKQTGSERPAGRLWEDDVPTRLIFLGSVALGNEEQPKAYGDDPKRDMAGILERIGPMRWRLMIPFPRSGAKLEISELTPVADQPGR
jgi:hypothetical protein